MSQKHQTIIKWAAPSACNWEKMIGINYWVTQSSRELGIITIMVDGPHLLHTAKKFLLENSMVQLPAVLERVGTLRKKSAKRFYIPLGLLLYIIDIHDDANIPLPPA